MVTQKLPSTINPNRSARLKTRTTIIEASEVLQETIAAAAMGEREKVVEKATLYLRRAEKYHLNKIALGLAGFLQAYYYKDVHDQKKGKKYHEIRKKYQELSYIEDLVDAKFLELSYRLNTVKTPSKALVSELEGCCKKFTEYLSFESTPINLRVYVLLIGNAYIKCDYEEVEELCNRIIYWLETRKFGYFSGFYSYLVPALIVQKKFEAGKEAITQALGNVNKKNNNWSIFTYFHFILEIHRKNYQEAYSIFSKANHRGNRNLMMKEQWLIIKGYIKFLQRQDLIEGTDQFRLDSLLQELPLATADKEGNNLNIIILSIILNLKRNRDQIIDQQETFKKYVQRHLKGNQRARLFIKMLLTISQYNFKPQVIQFRNQDNWKLLQKNNIQVVGMSEVEIIPYEDLWPMVLNTLEVRRL